MFDDFSEEQEVVTERFWRVNPNSKYVEDAEFVEE